MNCRFSKVGWKLLPGGLVALGFAILLKLGALQPLEQMVYNTFFVLRGETAWDDRLVLVTIDDASLDRLGRFPWSRQQYVRLLNVLTQGDPSVIAFDLIWSEASPDDARLAEAMQQWGRVVLASAKQQQTGLPLPPTAALQAAAIGTGHVLYETNADGVTRSVPAQVQGEPMFALAVAKAYSLVEAPVALPGSTEQQLWVNWAGRSRSMQQYSFADVVQGKIPAQKFQNKIVLIGVTATGLDQLATPFDQNPPASGLHLQAAVLHNLLQSDLLQPIGYGNWLDGARLLILGLGGPGLGLLLYYRRTPRQIAIWLLVSVGWSGLSFAAFTAGVWLPVALPLSLFTATLIAVQLVEQLCTNALLQRQIKHLWQQYQADLVLRSTDRDCASTAPVPGASVPSVTQLATIADQFGRSQSTQAAIARSLSIGLVASDLDGCVWFCNPVAQTWLAAQVGEQLETRLVPEWVSPEQWQADRQALQQQVQVPVREVRQGDRWIALTIEPLSYELAPKSSGRSLDGLLVMLEDITMRKQVEVVLAQQVEELQRLSQMKDDFLSTVSHELRAPLTNFRLAIDLLAISDSETERAQYLAILERECTRETELINDLLDLQRLDANARQRDLENIELQSWLPTIVEPFRDRAVAQQQTLQVEIASELPPIASDPHSLKRILVELVNNACKYTPPAGEITVTAQSTPPYLELVVSNSGAEIPPTELPRIFDKFYRVPKADQWQRGGTGLGLALVKKLVEHLSGTIHVRSGSGLTTFTVQLPLSQKPHLHSQRSEPDDKRFSGLFVHRSPHLRQSSAGLPKPHLPQTRSRASAGSV